MGRNPNSTVVFSDERETKPLLGSKSRFGRRFRVMYIVKNYPQISETYIKTEIEAVREICDVRIIATNAPTRRQRITSRTATLRIPA